MSSIAGNPKVSILLELKERIRGGLNSAKRMMSDSVRSMKQELQDLKNKATSTFSDISNKARGMKLSHVEAFQAMKSEIPGFSNLMGLLGNPYTLIIGGLLALGTAFIGATKMSLQWEKSMTKVNVTAQLNRKELKDLSGNLRDIGARNAVDLMEVPEAFNRIISAGLDVNTSLKVLEPTLQAAKAGFTDIETTAKAAVGVMNSSEVKDINQIYDILFATLNKGNAEFADIANYLPKIIPTARNIGVSLQDTAGIFAYFTAQGLQAERAATLLENAFKVLGDPDKVKKFKAIGISIYDAKGQMVPMIRIAEQLNAKLLGLSDKDKSRVLNSLDLDMEAASAFAVMSQDVVKLKDNIDFVTNSAGQLNEAIKNSKTSMDSWTIIGNQVKSLFMDIGDTGASLFGQLGDYLLPLITEQINAIKDGTSWINELWGMVGPIIEGALGTLWRVTSAIWEGTGALIKWIGKSELLRDLFWLIGQILQGVGNVILWVFEKIEWVWDHTIGPILDALETAYGWVKDFLGFGGDEKEVKITVNDKETTAKIGDNPLLLPKDTVAPGGKARTLAQNGIHLKDEKTGSEDSTRVTGRQEQIKNITINMEAFFKMTGEMMSRNPDISKMSKREFEQWIMELFNRWAASLEMSFS